ncbi:hypothetical protein HmCmsJML008_04485 [Escherichia coli]|nr:hypothetical protein HmCmsJML008_04485 [Escherichia coli]
MSDITIPHPNAVNGHTAVNVSTSIQHILAVRTSTHMQNDTPNRQLPKIPARHGHMVGEAITPTYRQLR